jgi:hypothetical protein
MDDDGADDNLVQTEMKSNPDEKMIEAVASYPLDRDIV